MTGDDLQWGGELCVSCGLPRADLSVVKGMNSTFNTFGLFTNESKYICTRCMELYKSKGARWEFMLFTEPAVKTTLEREDVLNILRQPPAARYVFTVPLSFQKHHWIHAGLSTPEKAYIGTDNGAVVFDYLKHDIPALVDLVVDVIHRGLSRKELTVGRYSVFTRSRFGAQLAEWEQVLAPLRFGGALDLIVRHVPAVKKKIVEPFKGEQVFSETEKKAVAVLIALAQASGYRRERGLEFWSSFFKRRIVRHLDMSLHDFFSRVAQSIYCETAQLDVSPVTSLDDQDKKGVMRELRTKTDLLLAAAYTAMKETGGKGEAQEKKTKKKEDENVQAVLF